MFFLRAQQPIVISRHSERIAASALDAASCLVNFLDTASLWTLLILALVSVWMTSTVRTCSQHTVINWLTAIIFLAYFFHRSTGGVDIEAMIRAGLVAGVSFGLFILVGSVFGWCNRKYRSVVYRFQIAVQDGRYRRETAREKKKVKEQTRRDRAQSRERELIAQAEIQAQQEREVARSSSLAERHNEQLRLEQTIPFLLPSHLYVPPYASVADETIGNIENTLRLAPIHASLFDIEMRMRAYEPPLPLPLSFFAHYRSFLRSYYAHLLSQSPDKDILLHSLESLCKLFDEDAQPIHAEAEQQLEPDRQQQQTDEYRKRVAEHSEIRTQQHQLFESLLLSSAHDEDEQRKAKVELERRMALWDQHHPCPED